MSQMPVPDHHGQPPLPVHWPFPRPESHRRRGYIAALRQLHDHRAVVARGPRLLPRKARAGTLHKERASDGRRVHFRRIPMAEGSRRVTQEGEGSFCWIEAVRQLRGTGRCRTSARLQNSHRERLGWQSVVRSSTVILGKGGVRDDFTGGRRQDPSDPPIQFRALLDGGRRAAYCCIQHCSACDRFEFYPRPFCRQCAGELHVAGRLRVEEPSIPSPLCGRVRTPPFDQLVPYVVALVDLDEGPRMMTNVVDCAPDDVSIGQRVEVVFADDFEGIALRFSARSKKPDRALFPVPPPCPSP